MPVLIIPLIQITSVIGIQAYWQYKINQCRRKVETQLYYLRSMLQCWYIYLYPKEAPMSIPAYDKKLQDAILDNSALTDDLTDMEAVPLIEWAMTLAGIVSTSIDSDEAFEEKNRNLGRLIKTTARYIARRHQKTPEELLDYLTKINEYRQTLGLSLLDAARQDTILNHVQFSDLELLQQFIYP